MTEPISGYDFLVLSTQDWDAVPTRKHRFARMYAAQGNRVLYIEQQMHWAGWLVDIKNQFSRAWRFLQGPREVEPNIWVYTLPVVLPFFQMTEVINKINNITLESSLKKALKWLRFNPEKLIIWTYTPHSADFVGAFGEYAAVYECVDEFTASKGLVNARAIGKMERDLLAKVDLLIVTAQGLLAKQQFAKRTKLVPNAAEVSHFATVADADLPIAKELEQTKPPVVGFLGSIQYWIDTDLLVEIARKHPDWTVVLVGPLGILADIDALREQPNVTLTGRVPYEEVPNYVKAFDVCLNPYHMDDVAEHCSPLKLYEYLATGKPVVSVDMPEVQQFKNMVSIAYNRSDFVSLVEETVSSLPEPPEQAQKRMQEAWNHTWEKRFEAASGALAEMLAEKYAKPT